MGFSDKPIPTGAEVPGACIRMSRKKIRITLTGARGRMARALLPDLSANYEDVIGVSRSRGDDFLSYAEWFDSEIFRRQDVILHLAWSSVPRTSEQSPAMEWRTDLPLLSEMFQELGKLPGSKPHFIFFSSAGTVYQNVQQIFREDGVLHPSCLYGWAKLHAEQLIRECAERIDFDYTILRISNLYGVPSRKDDQQGIIPYLIDAAINGRKFQVWGDGSIQKDYLYYTDLLRALKLVIEDKITGTFNLSYGRSYSIDQLISIVERLTGRDLSVSFSSGPQWDASCCRIDNSLIHKTCQWEPLVGIEDGIAAMLQKAIKK